MLENNPMFGTLQDIFYKYDPHGIAWIDPSGPDWYAGVTIEVLRGLAYALYPQDARDILTYEFHHRWEYDVGLNPRFEEMAMEVWQAWLREGQANEPH